jgi:hypothetical protein
VRRTAFRQPRQSLRAGSRIAGVREFWREWLAAWCDLRFDYELADAGDHVVILIGGQRIRGRFTDIDVA